MVRVNSTKISKTYCPFCKTEQIDPQRKRVSCSYCGAGPLPSLAYPIKSAFNPIQIQKVMKGKK